jgi:TRAP-type C4-dicarboxylate transport system substrate-binding protein
MKQVRVLTLLLVSFAAGCFICGTVAAAPVTMKVSIGTPENNFETKEYAEWGRLIEQNSKGEVKFQLYHSSQLFRDNEVVKAIQTGGVDAGAAFAMYMENQLVPAMKVLQMPFLFGTLEEALKVLHSDIGEAMKMTAEQKGVKLLGIVSYPSPDGEGLVTKKPAKVPADVKGMVLRTIGPELAAMMKKWGAGPSFLTGSEVYMALQRGTLQGAIASVSTMVERKFYEVAPYMIMLPYASVQTYLAVNKGFFDRLTPAQQKAVIDASATIDKNNYSFAMKTMDNDLQEARSKAKMYFPNVQELAKWKEGCEDVWAETAKGNKDVAEALTKVRAMLKR